MVVVHVLIVHCIGKVLQNPERHLTAFLCLENLFHFRELIWFSFNHEYSASFRSLAVSVCDVSVGECRTFRLALLVNRSTQVVT